MFQDIPSRPVRVRFAPSPTGGLHIGGVRTALFNYLFARKNNGKFIIRIEDTDQTRFVEGAEQYIFDCLEWCGITADESVINGGDFAPYRQSERKLIYRQYAERLVEQGHAYYAFDTGEDLEKMRTDFKTEENPSPQYDYKLRMKMRNSLSLSEQTVRQLLDEGHPYTIRIKIEPGETIFFKDMIRGEIEHSSSVLDDKVLLKADGMPTYHLAVVVDDYLMKISHALRGEEWLPSAPIHILLWKHLGWQNEMPQWAHLPLILKPDGNGKLSKRDGERLGFPVFAMNWVDPKTGEEVFGFKENGFLPEAFLNFLAFLGWHPGGEKEILTKEELIQAFSLERVQKAGAKFDYEKAKWFNQQHIHQTDTNLLIPAILEIFKKNEIKEIPEKLLKEVISITKERCHLLTDFVKQAGYFFKRPEQIDVDAIKGKWTDDKASFFNEWIGELRHIDWTQHALENSFEEAVMRSGIKKGELMMPLRVMIVGGKYGPGVFEIMEKIEKSEIIERIKNGMSQL